MSEQAEMSSQHADPERIERPGVGAVEFRLLMRQHPAGVTVITLDSGSGPVGFTATSFASLSADPPLISFNIAHTSSSLTALRSASSLVVHLLAEHQLEVAQRFSRAAEQRFAEPSSWSRLETGEPVLTGTDVWMRAAVRDLIELGDHTLVIGHVTDAMLPPDPSIPRPLIYCAGTYHTALPRSSR
jgi:flavin reductase (DIM6/NTAB) family NADH-FMN oxidoreductase RutF